MSINKIKKLTLICRIISIIIDNKTLFKLSEMRFTKKLNNTLILVIFIIQIQILFLIVIIFTYDDIFIYFIYLLNIIKTQHNLKNK